MTTIPGMKLFPPTEDFEGFRQDMLALLHRRLGTLPADQMLAVAAYMVGQLVAMQDQRTLTPAMAMQIVSANIEKGNRDVIVALRDAPVGGRA